MSYMFFFHFFTFKRPYSILLTPGHLKIVTLCSYGTVKTFLHTNTTCQ